MMSHVNVKPRHPLTRYHGPHLETSEWAFDFSGTSEFAFHFSGMSEWAFDFRNVGMGFRI